MFQLTKGSLRKILDGSGCVDPILQIMSMKNIQNNMDGLTRYKLTLFDGEMQHTFGILATQKNSLVENNELKVGSVIKLEEFASNVLSKDPPKVVVILLNFEILGEMDTKASANEYPKQTVQNENIEPKDVEKISPQKGKSFYTNPDTKDNTPNKNTSKLTSNNTSVNMNSQSGMFNNFKVFGISSLNPYQNKWSIKVRVTAKSDIRNYNNAKGPGKLFNCEFLDNTGEIRATGFNEQVEKFYDMLQVDNVYYVSKGTLKAANKQYSKTNNDYEMTFSHETVIEPCLEAEADELPHLVVNLVTLSDIAAKNKDDIVDVIGVVRHAPDVVTITSKANKELKKRELNLVDNTNSSIILTLWGKQAEDFDGSENPVILVKGAKVGEYNGKNLSALNSSTMQINPDIPEAHTLRGWFDQGGAADIAENTLSAPGGLANRDRLLEWKTVDLLKELGENEKGDYVMTKATLIFAKKDNSLYMACPTEKCNKKVVDQNDGTFRCEKCAKDFKNFSWRMILNVSIADHTDSNWATCFQESAELVLGLKADELGDLKNNNNPAYEEVFTKCTYKEYNFKLRAKQEVYNDEKRLKMSVVSMENIDYVVSGRRLIENIKNALNN